jgi:MerR family transcriptional regulator/heat shock protein HspR
MRRTRKKTGKIGYMISAVAEMYDIHPQTLRLYERERLLIPSRSEGNTRLYTQEDVERLEVILKLTRELGVNLAGVEIILNMRDRMSAMEKEVQAFMEFVRGQVVTYEADASRGQNAMVRVVPPRLIRVLSRQGEHHPAAESNQSHRSQLSAATRKP